jgi:molybdenum-dependent DNA-binding transcriptional regulator ModE
LNEVGGEAGGEARGQIELERRLEREREREQEMERARHKVLDMTTAVLTVAAVASAGTGSEKKGVRQRSSDVFAFQKKGEGHKQ